MIAASTKTFEIRIKLAYAKKNYVFYGGNVSRVFAGKAAFKNI